MRKSKARRIYEGSNGVATRKFLSELTKKPPFGPIAAQLLRTQKASARAKLYRGGIQRSDGLFNSYRGLAYDKKTGCLRRLCETLDLNDRGLTWGWGIDSGNPAARHVIYIDLPNGQVSFHSTERFVGPKYGGEWDESRMSEDRIIECCEAVWEASSPDGEQFGFS